MLPFFKKIIHKQKAAEVAQRAAETEPIVLIPLKNHKHSVQLSLFLSLTVLVKQNKFKIIHGEYEYTPYYPIIKPQEFYRVNFSNGQILYEITRERANHKRYHLTVNTPTQRLDYSPSKPFIFAKPLFEITATGKLSPDSERELAKQFQDEQPLHYLANLIVHQK